MQLIMEGTDMISRTRESSVGNLVVPDQHVGAAGQRCGIGRRNTYSPPDGHDNMFFSCYAPLVRCRTTVVQDAPVHRCVSWDPAEPSSAPGAPSHPDILLQGEASVLGCLRGTVRVATDSPDIRTSRSPSFWPNSLTSSCSITQWG